MTTTAITTTVPVSPPSGIEAKEPSRATGLIAAIVNAVFAGLTSYGITYKADLPHLITVLIIALITFFAFVLPIVQAEITRGKVWSAASVARIANAVAADAPAVIAAGEAIVKDVAAPSVPDGAPVVTQPAAPAV